MKHIRQVAPRLYLRGMHGNKASLILPEFNIQDEESSPLFLTLPDAIQEFKSWFKMGISNPNNPFTHLSKWIFVDQSSSSDDGNYHKNVQTCALDNIGNLSPTGWIWDPRGYYDNRNPLPHWAKWTSKGPVSYNELKARVEFTRDLNSEKQEFTEYSTDKMHNYRDKENCFRIVELAIPRNSEVTVLANPKYDSKAENKISLVPPELGNQVISGEKKEHWSDKFAKKGAISPDQVRFQFRILKGHTIDNLIRHIKLSIWVYFGLGVLGLNTVYYGQKLLKESK